MPVRVPYLVLSLVGWLCCTVMPLRSTARAFADEASNEKSAPAKELTSINLSDYRGRVWEVSDFADKEVLVVAFLGVECPLAKMYSQRLSQLQAEFSEQAVAIVGVDANPQDSLSELAAYARRHKIEFPLLRDGQQQLVGALGARRTPEVFVLDRQRRLQYHGRIDDQYGIGYVREAPQTHALRSAITAVLAGKTPLVQHEPAVGCLIGKPKQASNRNASTVTYSKHIAPIFRDSCVQCHREGEIGPFPMTDYAEISGWAEMIAEVVAEKRMPPWHANPEYGTFANDCSLTSEQRDLVLKWVAEGAPEGDPADLPAPRQYVSGWQLPREPDVVLNVSPKPYNVPATGEVKYQYFRVDPGFDEEKWFNAAQIIPGNHSVVHHILVFVRPKGAQAALDGERGFLFGYVPGSVSQPYPPGVAKRIPAGSELVFQVHYTPIGTPQTDASRIGFNFVEASSVQREVITTSAVQVRLNIPPEEGNYQISAMLPEDLPESELLGMSPHMHLRGKAFRYTAIAPDKSRQILLDVPRYDFNWQTGYRLAEPMQIQAGTRILCEATFDNSVANLNNPDPTSWVRWGDQTTDEMMIGYFDILVAKRDGSSTGQQRERRELVRRIIRDGLFSKLDTNGNERLERSEVPQRWKNQFDLLDADSNDEITRDEVRDVSTN